MKRALLTAALAPPILLVIQAVTASLLLPRLPIPEEAGMVLAVASTALTALLLAGLTLSLTARGTARVGILVLVVAGVSLNNLLEATFFPLAIPRAELVALFLQAVLSAVLFAAVLDRLAGPASAPLRADPPRGPTSWAARVAACEVAYIALYVIAGLLAWPFVRHFYAVRPMPTLPQVVLMQVFRGLVFTAIAYVLARTLPWSRLTTALAVGLTLSLLGGVFPLLAPNPYMPASIRWPHLVEVGVSNLLFGSIAAWLLGRSGERAFKPIDERVVA